MVWGVLSQQGDNTANDISISDLNGLSVMEYSGADGFYHQFSESLDIRTCFWVVRRIGGVSFLLGGLDFHSDWHNQNYFKAGFGPPPENLVVKKNGELAQHIKGYDGNSTIAHFDPSNYQVISYVNSGVTSATASSFSSDRGISGRFFQGGLAELIIFDNQLSTSDVELVEGYLSAKWGVGD